MSKYYVFSLVCLVCLVFTVPSFGEEIHRARYPEISPDGTKIAFSYLGDLWVVPSDGGKAGSLELHGIKLILQGNFRVSFII